jgi:hypothetical protein
LLLLLLVGLTGRSGSTSYLLLRLSDSLSLRHWLGSGIAGTCLAFLCSCFAAELCVSVWLLSLLRLLCSLRQR